MPPIAIGHLEATDPAPIDLSKAKASKIPPSAPHLLPTYAQEDYPPYEPFEYTDRGLNAKGQTDKLLANATVIDTTPELGSDVTGVQLSQLTDEQKDQLAYFVAERGVVFFRDQDINLDMDKQIALGEYFSTRLHVHPTSGHPVGYPQVHVVYQDDQTEVGNILRNSNTSIRWHSDVSYELQPPSYTFLAICDLPERGGGDTLWVSCYEAYDRLSRPMQLFLEGLTAIHSGVEQAQASADRGGVVRRAPVTNEHPVVRTHPVTGRKALFVNPQFTRKIVQLKQEESDSVLNFLYAHQAQGADFQARFRWAKGSVAVWDNRITAHTAILDYKGNERRHAVRVTPQAERPYL